MIWHGHSASFSFRISQSNRITFEAFLQPFHEPVHRHLEMRLGGMKAVRCLHQRRIFGHGSAAKRFSIRVLGAPSINTSGDGNSALGAAILLPEKKLVQSQDSGIGEDKLPSLN